MARADAVARPYAQALFELAREGGALDAWQALLDTAATAAADAQVLRLLDAPGSDSSRLAQMLLEVAGSEQSATGVAQSAQAKNFMRLLAENRRIAALPAIAQCFSDLKAEVENTVNVVLTAASEVDEAQQRQMSEALSRRFGRQVSLRFVLDEQLIGGARLQADDHVIDGSVRTRLEKLASTLVQ